MTNAILNTTQSAPGVFIQTPGQPVAVTGAIAPQVGAFPANANNQGATSTKAEMSKGTLSGQVLTTNEGLTAQTLMAALSNGTDGGNQSTPANGIPFGSGFSGGGGGPGGSPNANSGQGVIGDVVLAAQALPANLLLQGGAAATVYG